MLDAGPFIGKLEFNHLVAQGLCVPQSGNRSFLAAVQLHPQEAIVSLIARRRDIVAAAVSFKCLAPWSGPLKPAEPSTRAGHGRLDLLHLREAAALMPGIAEHSRRIFLGAFEVSHELPHQSRHFRLEDCGHQRNPMKKPPEGGWINHCKLW
jgi:hypothetical protein